MQNGSESENLPDTVVDLEDVIEILSEHGNIILNNKSEVRDLFENMNTSRLKDKFENKIERLFRGELEPEAAKKLRVSFLTALYSIQTNSLEEMKSSEINNELITFLIDIVNEYGTKHLELMQKSSVGENAWLNAEINIRINDEDQMIFDYVFTRHNDDKLTVSNTFSTNMSLIAYILQRQSSSFDYLNAETASQLDIESVKMLKERTEAFLEDLNKLEERIDNIDQ